MTDRRQEDVLEGLIEELLAGHGDPNELLRPIGGDDEQRRARREGLEILGLLPRALEPKAPSPDVKDRLMAEVARSGPAVDAGAGADTPPESNEPSPLFGTEAADAEPAGGRGPRWLLPLAATIAFFALGVAAWQASSVAKLRATVERQAAELESARAELAGIEGAAEALAIAHAKLALLTTTGSEFCALKPGRDSRMQQARGTLVMHPSAEHWFMKVVGLDPSAEGYRYQLWYLTPEGPVPAVSFGFADRATAVEVMPDKGGEGVEAVMITLEPVGSEAPSSPALLYGDERMQIL